MKISVVIPTLNSAEYIRTSLDSLAAQTCKDIEIVVVDSGSADNTVDIILSYIARGLSVQIIPASECPPAMARNLGIEKSAGAYVAFCDSDDSMKPDMLEMMYEAAIDESADIVVCDFDMVYPEQTIENFARMFDERFDLSDDNITDYYYSFCASPKPNNYVWSRLYKRNFLIDNGIRFPDTRYSEDHLLNLSSLFKKPKIVHIGRSLYRYIQRDDSAMRQHIRQTNHGLLFLDCFKKASEMLGDKRKIISDPILAIYAYTRIKSILFYAWQAKLPETETMKAVSVFASDSEVKQYLAMCLERDYINRYRLLHGLSAEWENIVRAMLRACLSDTALPEMSEVFH